METRIPNTKNIRPLPRTLMASVIAVGIGLCAAPAFSQVSFDLHVGTPAPAPVIVEPAQPEVIQAPPADAAPAEAEGVVAVAPPAPIVESAVIVEAPAPSMIWVPGYYVFDAPVHRYQWIAGAWQNPPREGQAWIAPRYDGGRYFAGHWGNHGEAIAASRAPGQLPMERNAAYGNAYANDRNAYSRGAYAGGYNRGNVVNQASGNNSRVTATTTTTATGQRGYATMPNNYGRGYASGYTNGYRTNSAANTATTSTTRTTTSATRGYVGYAGTPNGLRGYATQSTGAVARGAASNRAVSTGAAANSGRAASAQGYARTSSAATRSQGRGAE